MEVWRVVWRDAVAPLISDRGLEALRRALMQDDETLCQGGTTVPPPLQCTEDYLVEKACLVAFPFWKGDGLDTVGRVEEEFARVCFEADQKLGEPAGIRWLLNWYDNVNRQEMRRLMLPEVEIELAKRVERS